MSTNDLVWAATAGTILSIFFLGPVGGIVVFSISVVCLVVHSFQSVLRESRAAERDKLLIKELKRGRR